MLSTLISHVNVLLGYSGTSSIIGVSHRVSDARKRSFVRSLISYCPLEGSVAHSCRYEAQLKEERKDHLR